MAKRGAIVLFDAAFRCQMFFSEYSLLNLVFLIYFFSVFSFLCSCLTLVDLDIETPSLPFSGSLISNVSVFVFALLHRFVIFFTNRIV